ncbi:MAG: alpha/beta hydrolase family protein [bacterium]
MDMILKYILNLKDFFAGITLCLLLTNCAHYSMSPDYKGPKTLPEEIKEEFSYKKNEVLYKEKILEKKEKYAIKEITFASAHNILPTNHDICIQYYDINGDEKTPVIMVLPILGGSYSIAKRFASYFSENGYASVIVHRQKEYKSLKNIDKIDIVLKQMVLDHMQTIDWFETQEDIDKGKIGIFGVSMGGIKGSLVSALDDRIDAAVLALAAGDIPYLLTYSKEKGIIDKKKKLLMEKKLTPDELYNSLRDIITCDPMEYAEYINANNVLMILARFDKIVPFTKGKELRDKMGKPETIYLLSGHYTAYPYIFYIKRESLQFFRRKFEK